MNQYKSCLIVFVGATLAFLFFHVFLFYVNLGVPIEQDRYLQSRLEIKDNYAQSIAGRKIMIIAGSNAIFGIDAAQIEKTLKIPTVNYGVNAGLGYYLFERAKKNLKKGDIVILPLEYRYYESHKNVFENELAIYLTGYDKEYINNSLSFLDKINLITQLRTRDLLRFSYQQIVPPNGEKQRGSREKLDINGDILTNKIEDKKTDEELYAQVKDKVFSDLPLTDDADQKLSDFITWCKANNITVYATWPSYLCHNKVFSESDIEGINEIESFYQKHDVQILGNYSDFLYDVDWFYDTIYHLNERGKQKRTEHLLDLLRDKCIGLS